MTTLTASDIAARRIQEARKKRKWTVRELAVACDKAGAGKITAAVITNLESRRRPGREITAEEVLALAWVLGVPPLQLLAPVSDGEALAVVPGEEMAPLDAAGWLTDDDMALVPVWRIRNPRTRTEPALRPGTSPLTILRQLRSVTRALRNHDRAVDDEQYRAATGETRTWHENSVTIMALRLLRLLGALEVLGYTPPAPAELEIGARRGLPPTLAEWESADDDAFAGEGEPDGESA